MSMILKIGLGVILVGILAVQLASLPQLSEDVINYALLVIDAFDNALNFIAFFCDWQVVSVAISLWFTIYLIITGFGIVEKVVSYFK